MEQRHFIEKWRCRNAYTKKRFLGSFTFLAHQCEHTHSKNNKKKLKISINVLVAYEISLRMAKQLPVCIMNKAHALQNSNNASFHEPYKRAAAAAVQEKYIQKCSFFFFLYVVYHNKNTYVPTRPLYHWRMKKKTNKYIDKIGFVFFFFFPLLSSTFSLSFLDGVQCMYARTQPITQTRLKEIFQMPCTNIAKPSMIDSTLAFISTRIYVYVFVFRSFVWNSFGYSNNDDETNCICVGAYVRWNMIMFFFLLLLYYYSFHFHSRMYVCMCLCSCWEKEK